MIVRVPASSANLGPGFDCLGLAWKLYNEIGFYKSDRLIISGCPAKYRNKDNLAYVGFQTALRYAGRPETPVDIRFLKTDIPVSRGLGSSAALISGGVIAANALHDLGLSGEELVTVAAGVEGHPDNIAPAILGGLTASAMDGGRAVTARFAVSDKLRFTVLVPDFELSTELARRVMPRHVSMADAVFNLSRTALLLKGLETGDGALIALGVEDRLHQPYRSGLIEGYDRARELALALGAAGVCISGAGSTVLCVARSDAFAPAMAEAMRKELSGWRVLSVEPERNGAQIVG